ncbi:hypothetical protein HJ590_02200 [Naumannella sp. ID2617S]|nr:hypothetical protein [Naumannella sp. ID2617S]
MVRRDPLDHPDSVRPGCRLSLRLATPDGLTDRVGVLVSLAPGSLVLEDRTGERHTIEREQVAFARVIPTVARGRNPLAFDPGGLRALAHDAWLGGSGACWVARLADLVDHLDDSGVRQLSAERAIAGDSRGLVNGEWAAVRLAAVADLDPLAAWAARRTARNLVLTSPLPDAELTALALHPLPD